MLLALSEDNETSSRTLPPWSYHLLGRCASQASGAAPASLPGLGARSSAQKLQSLPRAYDCCWKGGPRGQRAAGPGRPRWTPRVGHPGRARRNRALPSPPGGGAARLPAIRLHCLAPREPESRAGREQGLPGQTEWGRESVRPKGQGLESLKWGASAGGGARGSPVGVRPGRSCPKGTRCPPTFAPASGLQGDQQSSVLPCVCVVGPLPTPAPGTPNPHPRSPRESEPVEGPVRNRRVPAPAGINTPREGARGEEAPGGRRAGAGLTGGPSARAGRGCWGRGQEASRGPGRPARPRDVARLPGISPRGPGPLLPALLLPSPTGPRLRAAAGISRSQLAGWLALGPSLLLLPFSPSLSDPLFSLPSPFLLLSPLFLSNPDLVAPPALSSPSPFFSLSFSSVPLFSVSFS